MLHFVGTRGSFAQESSSCHLIGITKSTDHLLTPAGYQ